MRSYYQKHFCRLSWILAWVLAVAFIFGNEVLAQTTAFSYQGKLTDMGNPANANYDLQFKLFDALAGGVQQGSVLDRFSVTATAGVFTVTLDFSPVNVFTGANRYLEIGVRPANSAIAYTVLTPRQPILSAPYAIQSLFAVSATNATTAVNFSGSLAGDITGTQTATALANNTVTTAKLADGSVTDAKIATVAGSKVTGTIPVAAVPAGSGSYIQNGTLPQAASNFSISGSGFIGGSLAIGNSFPFTPLHVTGAIRSIRDNLLTQYLQLWGGDSASIRLTAQSTAAAEKPLLIQNLSGEPTPGSGNTIQFQLGTTAAPSTKMQIDKDGKVRIGISAFAGSKPMLEVADVGNAVGVYGLSLNNYGIYGDSSNSNGVVGISNSGDGMNGTSNTGNGVYGSSSAASLTVAGVHGRSYGSAGIGVFGEASNANAIGVYGFSQSATGVGMFARNQSGGYAGYFDGNVFVNGTINKAAVGFKIDHPLDPANKYLYHTGIESPDMMNLYNGVATLGEFGMTEITLPDWFEALNRDFRYQLTAIGMPGPNLYIAEKVKGNRFKIAGGAPGMEVSWQITGTRQDAYANAHRMPIEEEKSEKERGYYLRPELFGQPEERGLEWAIRPEQMKQQKEQRERGKHAQPNQAATPAARPNQQ